MALQRAGQRHVPAIIQRQMPRRGADGSEVLEWVDFARPFVEVLYTGAGETFDTQHTVPKLTATMRMPYQSGIEPRMRVLCNDSQYEIVGVSETVYRRELTLTCHAFDVES